MGRIWTLLALSALVAACGVMLRMSWEPISEPAEAQTTGTCPRAQLIDTFEGNGVQQTDTFRTTTDSLRISFDATNTAGNNIAGYLFIDVIDAGTPNGLPVATLSQEGDGRGETFANAPPGTYYLDIGAANLEYAITVEQCEGGNPDGPGPQPRDPPVDPAPPTPIDEDPNGGLLDAGGPKSGPFPLMPDGSCPKEFPAKRGGACY